MQKSNFSYLEKEFPILYNTGQSAEYNLYNDPVTSLFKLRQFGEKLSELLFEEHHLEFPYDNNFHNRLKALEYEGILPQRIKDLLFTLKQRGNLAVHEGKGTHQDATTILFSAFKVAKWFYETYSVGTLDISDLKFHKPAHLDTRHALTELENQYRSLEERFHKLLEERSTGGLSLEKKIEIKSRSEKAASKIEMSEAETRELIDAQLRSAGWEVDSVSLNYKSNRTRPEKGRNLAIAEWPAGTGWADYALFIDTALYAVVEAKKYAQDISTDLGQSKRYAKELSTESEIESLGEWNSLKTPFLFSTNGRPYLEQIKTKSGIWFLDVRHKGNISKCLQGWYSPEGLQKLFSQDVGSANAKLQSRTSDFLKDSIGLGLRDYQVEAIKAVEKTILEKPENRRVLLAMATGTGKTRTIIGLCYRLIQTNRFNRILFLVDRTMLAKQALDSFSDNKIEGLNTFAEMYEVKGLKDQIPDIDTRLHFATVQSMVKRLFYTDDDTAPSVDQYDCIIIDEAHRGYLLDREMDEEDLSFKDQKDYISKYRMVLDYFDAFAVGLTATPALHTKEIFGTPVYTYSYREAVIDGFLIDHEPPFLIKTRLSEEGIVWKKGEKPKVYDRESNSIVELQELEDELKIEISGFNKMVLTESFNRTVIAQLVQELDPDGDEKTLVFAATDEHADEVVRIFKEEFQKIGLQVSDDCVKKITGKTDQPQQALTRFKNEKYPTIAVTVDLLTTGIDVPKICNLVFMRRIKSRILYEQMLGRATRRCDEIKKETFRIYDAVKIYEALEDYTQMTPVVANPKTTFSQLASEAEHIESEERARRQIDQIMAKFQRKRKKMSDEEVDQFNYNARGHDPDSFIHMLKNSPAKETLNEIMHWSGLWKFLDELKPDHQPKLWSDHEDEYLTTGRGYGRGQKPEDYLESFAGFIKSNQTRITALNVICTRPKELDRKSLKELMLALDQEGYSPSALKAAWKDAKNEDIAADIISFVRTMALGDPLLSHEERISRAMDKIRSMRNWNKVQQKWLDRFEMQLIRETIIRKEDLDQSPFNDAGGFDRLNKIFDNELEDVISHINDNLYGYTG